MKSVTAEKPKPSKCVIRGSRAQRVVQSFVVERAFERRQLLPEVAGRGGHQAVIEGFAVAPALNQGEMVRPADHLQHVEE